MNIVKIVLDVFLVISSVLLILLILLHKGKGGGLSDMFGGGIASASGSSGVAEKNLNRFTLLTSLIWIIAVILIGVIDKIPV